MLDMTNDFSRRSLLGFGLGAVAALVIPRCVPIPVYIDDGSSGGNGGGGSGGGGSGGSGINPADFAEPEGFLGRPEVSGVLSQLRSKIAETGMVDYPLFLSRGRDPPNIAQSYDIADGLQLIPTQGPLARGSFRWFNQTPQLHISTDYSQFPGEGILQQGVSSLGEIIRGEKGAYSLDGVVGDVFTVYSLIRSNTNLGTRNCATTSATIFDGAKFKEEGVDVAFVNYCNAPLSDSGCGAIATAGAFILIQQGYGYLYTGKSRQAGITERANGLIERLRSFGENSSDEPRRIIGIGSN